MKLNKNDEIIFRNFCNQIEQGFNDEKIDTNAPKLKKYIENNYTSTNNTFTLEDFISEAILIICNSEPNKIDISKKHFLTLSLNKLYKKMNKTKGTYYQEKSPIYKEYYFDESKPYVEIFLKKIKPQLKEREFEIFTKFYNGATLIDIAEEYQVSQQRISQILKLTKQKIMLTEEYQHLQEDSEQIKRLFDNAIKIEASENMQKLFKRFSEDSNSLKIRELTELRVFLENISASNTNNIDTYFNELINIEKNKIKQVVRKKIYHL